MEELIPLDKFIEQAVINGVDFGKADPYNRLRYYTKIGLLPHMVRKSVNGEIIGHYPKYALDKLIQIEKLKSLGLSNQEIKQKLENIEQINPKNPEKIIKIARLLTPGIKSLKMAIVITLILLALISTNFIPIINKNQSLIEKTSEIDKIYIQESGSYFVEIGQNKVFIKSSKIRPNSKVNITFTSDYSPASRYWVSQIIPFEGFYLELDAPINTRAEFNWWITK